MLRFLFCFEFTDGKLYGEVLNLEKREKGSNYLLLRALLVSFDE